MYVYTYRYRYVRYPYSCTGKLYVVSNEACGNVTNDNSFRVVYFANEGSSVNGMAVIIDGYGMRANLLRHELGSKTVVYVAADFYS